MSVASRASAVAEADSENLLYGEAFVHTGEHEQSFTIRAAALAAHRVVLAVVDASVDELADGTDLGIELG